MMARTAKKTTDDTVSQPTCEPAPTVAAIHDLSGFGKCSLTIALPVLSAAGIETSVIPTALLSTHTGGFKGYTYRDLTDDIESTARHWAELGLKFDAVYSGFLGSERQTAIVSRVFDLLRRDGGLIVVDPVMADHGRLYSTYTAAYPKRMRTLCARADIILPNITEAFLLTGRDYFDGPYRESFVVELLHELAAIGSRQVVITGIDVGNDTIGVATLRRGNVEFLAEPRVLGHYHGTGDLFASALLGAVLNGFELEEAAGVAIRFTAAAIRHTREAGTDPRFGLQFERLLPHFLNGDQASL